MTRAEKNKTISDIMDRYDDRIGDLIVGDNGALARLLGTLQFDISDSDVGEYLCTYLVA